MPISIFINERGRLVNRTRDYFDREYSGWWNTIKFADLDGDKRPELLIGNLGLNTQCQADPGHPAELYYKDFDNNGAIDPVLCLYTGETAYPFMSRDELIQQVVGMSQRFPDYKSYANAKLTDIFPAASLKDAGRLRADCLRTMYFAAGADGRFHERRLPPQAQYSPVYTITPLDFDRDGRQDLLLCGNMNHARLRFGKQDANYGVLLKGDGKGNFTYVDQSRSGFHITGDVRSVLAVDGLLLFGVNGVGVKAYKSR
jgi:hypothetical protein